MIGNAAPWASSIRDTSEPAAAKAPQYRAYPRTNQTRAIARSPGAMPLDQVDAHHPRGDERRGDQHGGVDQGDDADADHLADQQLARCDHRQQHLDDPRRLLPRHRREHPAAVHLQHEEQEDVGDHRRADALGVDLVVRFCGQRLDVRRRRRADLGGLVRREPGGAQPVLQRQLGAQHADERRPRRPAGQVELVLGEDPRPVGGDRHVGVTVEHGRLRLLVAGDRRHLDVDADCLADVARWPRRRRRCRRRRRALDRRRRRCRGWR